MKQSIEGVLRDLKNCPSNPICSHCQEMIQSALSAITKIRLEELPKEKEHKEWCREFMKKGSCNCMNPDYNQAIADARERIK